MDLNCSTQSEWLRILGMGDVLSLIEKAQQDVDQEKLKI